MQDYKPNSNRFKEEQAKTTAPAVSEKKKEIQKVVKDAVIVKKKNPAQAALDKFMKEDVGNIKSYIVHDVIIPTIKNTIWDAFTNSLDMILFGGNGQARKNGAGSSRNAPYVSYNKMSDNRAGSSRNTNNSPQNRFDFDSIVFTTNNDAKTVLSQMDAIIDEYKIVTVADFFDFAGQTCDYTYQYFGWTNLRNAKIIRARNGYVIDFPRPMSIDR